MAGITHKAIPVKANIHASFIPPPLSLERRKNKTGGQSTASGFGAGPTKEDSGAGGGARLKPATKSHSNSE